MPLLNFQRSFKDIVSIMEIQKQYSLVFNSVNLTMPIQVVELMFLLYFHPTRFFGMLLMSKIPYSGGPERPLYDEPEAGVAGDDGQGERR